MFLSHLRDQLSIKGIRNVSLLEPLANVRPVIFLQFAPGAAAHRGVARPARRVHVPRRLRQDRHRGQRGHRPDQHQRGVLVDGLPRQPGRRTCKSRRIAPAATARSPGASPNDSSLLIDATLKQAFPPLALPTRNTWSARARSGTRSACRRIVAAAALARLHARRLGRRLGNLRPTRRQRRLGKERQGNLCAPPRRADA